MWGFPSVQTFISGNVMMILITLFAVIFAAVCWIKFYLSIARKTKESDADFIKNIGGGIFCFAFSLITFLTLVSDYRKTSNCRKLDLNQVKAARIRKMSDANSFTGSTLRYEDSDKLRQALKYLRTADVFNRQKTDNVYKAFTLGYQVQLIFEDESDGPTINYFYENIHFREINVVIPKCAVPSDNINSDDEVYSSEEFGNWIRDEIVPQFKNIQ